MVTPESIIAVISRELGEQHLAANRISSIQPGYMLDEDLGVASIDRVCITCALDEEFGIELPDDDVAKWETVGDIVASVSALVKREAA